MNLYSKIVKHILLPIAEKKNKSNILKEWKLNCKMDFCSKEELIKLQNKRLQLLVKHCYDNVPYYTKLFNRLSLTPEDIKCREDLVKLPILTKQIIRENYDDIISLDIAKRKTFKHSTGGSTGVPLQFQSDIDTWNMSWASSFRAWEWYGFSLGEKIFTLAGNSLVKNGEKKRKWSRKNIFDRVIMCNYKHSSANVSDEDMHKHYLSFMKLRPVAIRGYASSLVIFARYIKKNQLPICSIKVILTTGEVLMPEYRATLQEVFKAPLYDGYGAGDGGIASHECYMHEGLHIAEERCVIEITDNNGNVLPDGELGYVTTTDLGNYAFPFLRYHVGDMSYIKKDLCSCGRKSRLFGPIAGRAGRLLYNKQGVPISPTMLPIMLYKDLDYHDIDNQILYNKIDKFQIRQDKEGDIKILLKLKQLEEDYSQFNYVIENFQNHFKDSNIELNFITAIPLMPSGKEDYCISEYKHNK